MLSAVIKLIAYPFSDIRPLPSGVYHFQRYSPKPLYQSKTPWEGGTTVYINGPGSMTKIAANGPVNAHLISGPRISTKHTKLDVCANLDIDYS